MLASRKRLCAAGDVALAAAFLDYFGLDFEVRRYRVFGVVFFTDTG
jgi:uncharacterized membrane protein